MTIRLMRQLTTPSERATHTARWTETMFRALTQRVANRWRLVSFRGRRGAEWRGIIDVLAIRKDTSQPRSQTLKRGDLLDFIIVQLKGGGARGPTDSDKRRLIGVQRALKARAIVLYTWKRDKHSVFQVLDIRSRQWCSSSAKSLFG
ncbi:MAG: hypothetical protein ACT4P7_03980 [Gemmatimonadaceae bacterium]